MTQYSLGESVLCSQGILIYEAKIQDVKKDKGVTLYGVHYKGWNKSWDEYVTDARLLKVTEENIRKQKELQDEVKKKKKPSTSKKGVKKSGSDSENSSREGSKDKEVTSTKSVAVRLERLKKDSESGDYNVNKEEEDKPVIKSKTRTIKPVIAFKATEVPKSMKKKSKKDIEREAMATAAKSKPEKSQESLRSQSPAAPTKRKRNFGDEIVVTLTDGLKAVLVDDFDYMDRQRKLFNIPARYSVDDLINDYISFRKERTPDTEDGDPEESGEGEGLAAEEVCRGLRDYFNCALGSQLLYKFERVQYADVLR